MATPNRHNARRTTPGGGGLARLLAVAIVLSAALSGVSAAQPSPAMADVAPPPLCPPGIRNQDYDPSQHPENCMRNDPSVVTLSGSASPLSPAGARMTISLGWAIPGCNEENFGTKCVWGRGINDSDANVQCPSTAPCTSFHVDAPYFTCGGPGQWAVLSFRIVYYDSNRPFNNTHPNVQTDMDVFIDLSACTANDPPVASCTATEAGPPGEYHFVATASDPNGDALSYTWTYGDGSAPEPGDNRTHDYALPGLFAASVTVADTNGGSGVAHCPVDVPAPELQLVIQFPDKDDGRVQLDETVTVRLRVSASANGVGPLEDLAFEGDALRLSPDGHLEIADGPRPAIPATFDLQPGADPLVFEYDVHVIGLGLATLATRVAGKDAAGRDVDTGEISRNVSAPALKVTLTPETTPVELDADRAGKPVAEEIDVLVKVENVTDDDIADAILGPLDLAAADPGRTYDPFPAEVLGDNDNVDLGPIAAHETKEVTRRVKVLADGRMKLSSLVTSSAGNALGEEELRSTVQTLLEMTIDGDATRDVTAGSAISFFGRFTNVSNDRTVALTDPMKVRRDGNLVGGGSIAATATGDDFPPPLIAVLAPGEDVEFLVTFNTERPTIADYDAGTAGSAAWTQAQVNFNVWIRAAVKEDDDSWQALSTDDPCICEYPESVVIEGGSFGAFDIVIDTAEVVSDGGQFGSAAFGFSLGALQGAQRRLSGLLDMATNVGRFVLSSEFRDETMSEELIKGRLKDALDYLSEFAVWLPAAEADEVAATVGANLADAYGVFTETVTNGIPHPEDTRTAEALTAMAREYIDHLQGAWRRGDPNELIDAVMPVGGIVGEQLTDVVVGEAVFEALAHLATVPRYVDLAAANWRDARTIEEMRAKLPSLAVQADLLDATERSKSNFIVLEDAYQARRSLSDPELGGASTGAGLARDTIATGRQWTRDNPNQVIVVVPNEPQGAALRDAGLAVGKIENIKPKSMATIEYLVFGGRAEDRNAVILRNLQLAESDVDARIDALIAAGDLVEEDRLVAKQILVTRQKEWKLFTDRGIKDPGTGEVSPDPGGIGRLKAYDETGKIPNQFRGEDNGITFSGPQQNLDFKLEYYKNGELLPAARVGEADYVVLLQEHPTSGALVKIVGDDDALFIGLLNGLGLPPAQLEAAYSSIWSAFNHPFSDTWLAHIGSAVKAKLKIFSRYFTTLPGTGEAGKPLIAFLNGEAYAVKIDAYLSRFDPLTNRAYIKYVGLPQGVDPIHPGGWLNAVLRPLANMPWPATFLRSFLHVPGAATNPDLPPVTSAKRARVLRVNEVGHVESWTPTTGWRLDPAAEAQAEAGTVTVAPQTQVLESILAGAIRVEITSQAEMGLAGAWFAVGDEVVLDPGGPNEETATVAGFGSLVFETPLQFGHEAGEMITLLPPTAPETTIESGPPAVTNSLETTFTMSSDQPAAGFQCRLDGGEWGSCQSPYTTDDVSDGQRLFEVRAVAGADVDESPATATWRVDTREPTITVAAPAAGAVVEQGSSVPTGFSCGDPGGSGVTSCAGAATLDTGTLGTNQFTVIALDAAGNQAMKRVEYQVVARQCIGCRLVVSRVPSRAAAVALDGLTLIGPLYIFVSDDPSIRSVRFTLGAYTRTDSAAPWDLAALGARALPVLSALLARGRHVVTARLTLANGTKKTLTATFTILR